MSFVKNGTRVVPSIGILAKNLNELKQELELDVHSVDIQELCKRFNTNLERGLTKEGAEEGRKLYGLNALTPPPTTPGKVDAPRSRSVPCLTETLLSEWVKFCQNLFGGFALLLWFGAILCFIAYSIQVSRRGPPS